MQSSRPTKSTPRQMLRRQGGGHDPYELPSHPARQPDRGATHTSLEPSSGRPLRQRQTVSKHGVPQLPSGLSQHDVVSITQGQRRRSDGTYNTDVAAGWHSADLRCRNTLALPCWPRTSRAGAKPSAGLSLSGARPQGLETVACLGKDRRSAGFGPFTATCTSHCFDAIEH